MILNLLIFYRISAVDPISQELKDGYLPPNFKKVDRNNRGIYVANPITKINGRILRNSVKCKYQDIKERSDFSAHRT